MSNHTLGPWSIWNVGNKNDPSCKICGKNGKLVAQTLSGNDLANARLIVAAPDLLEACKTGLLWAATDKVRHILRADFDKAFQPMRNAIAKAEGH